MICTQSQASGKVYRNGAPDTALPMSAFAAGWSWCWRPLRTACGSRASSRAEAGLAAVPGLGGKSGLFGGFHASPALLFASLLPPQENLRPHLMRQLVLHSLWTDPSFFGGAAGLHSLHALRWRVLALGPPLLPLGLYFSVRGKGVYASEEAL